MGDGLFDRSYCSKLDNLDNVPIRFQFSSTPGPVLQRLLYCISGTALLLTRVPAVLPSIKYSMVQAGAEPNPSKCNIAAMLARKHTHTHTHTQITSGLAGCSRLVVVGLEACSERQRRWQRAALRSKLGRALHSGRRCLSGRGVEGTTRRSQWFPVNMKFGQRHL